MVSSVLLSDSNFEGLLRSGDIDIFISDSAYLSYIASQSEGEFQVAGGLSLNPAQFSITVGITVGKDNGISEAIAAAINQMMAESSYCEIVAKWYLESDAIVTSEVRR